MSESYLISYGAGLAAPSLMGGVADIALRRLAFGLAAAIAAGAGMLGRTAANLPALTPAGASRGEAGPAES
jgi:hypothetical protein